MRFDFPFAPTRRVRGALACALAAALAGWGATAQAADASADATATVVRPITINKTFDLRFGSFSTANAGQTVVISPAGTRVLTGALGVTSTFGAAEFTVNGEGSLTYAVTLPGSISIETDGGGVGKSMTVGNFISTPTVASGGTLSGTLGSTGSQTLTVGGTLTTHALQVAGEYTGNFTVSVDYN